MTLADPASNSAVPRFAIPLLATLALLAIVSLAYGCRNAFRDGADLERRAEEADLFRHRSNPYTDPDATYPPPALPLFAATVSSQPLLRRATWLVFSLVAMVAVAWLCMPADHRWPHWVMIAFALIVVASKPTRAGLSLGQFHLIPLAMMLATERLARRYPFGAAIAATIALAKPTMSLPVMMVLAVRARWRTLVYAGIIQVGLFAFTSVWLGVGPIALVRDWLHNARSQLALGTIDLPSLILQFDPRLTPYVPIITAGVLLTTGAILMACRHRSQLGLVALSAFAAALMTYHRHYDLVLLLPALAYLIDDAIRRGHRHSAAAAFLFGAALILPSDGRIIGNAAERIYDQAFLVWTYLVLGLVLYQVGRETKKNTDDPGLA